MSKTQLSIIGIVVIGLIAAMNHRGSTQASDAKTKAAVDQLAHVTALTLALESDHQLRDPDSIQIVNWTDFDCNAQSWHSTVTFRAKNGFGGYSVERAKIDHQGDRSDVRFMR